MSQLIVDINNIIKFQFINQKRSGLVPLRCRIIAQFIDVNHINPTIRPDGFLCTLTVKNLPGFNLTGVSNTFNIYVDESSYTAGFMNNEIKPETGDAVDLKIISWSESDYFVWELLDLKVLTTMEVDALHSFIKGPAGQELLAINHIK